MDKLKLVIPNHNCCGNCKHLRHVISVKKDFAGELKDETFACEIIRRTDFGDSVPLSFYSEGDWDNDDTRLERWLYVCGLWRSK